MEFTVGMRLKRKSKGNMERSTYEQLIDKIVIVTEVTFTHIKFRREDGGSLTFKRNSKDYASKVWEPANIIHVGGE